MIADLTAAQARVKALETENAGLKAKLATQPTPPAVTVPKAPASKTPTWDAYYAIKEPGRQTAFYTANEAALKAEMKASNSAR
jgi:hypothetical protein